MKCLVLCALVASFYSSAVTAQIKPPPRVAVPLKDVIVSSQGVREGKLSGCVSAVCSMDNVSTFGIVWIGLKADVRSRPAPTDPARDEVRYHDGSVHPGRLIGINANLVVTERGRHQRAMVAWVYLAPRRETGNAPGQLGAPGETPGETVIKPPKKDDEAGGEPPVAGPSSDPPPPGKRGGLWIGKIKQRWVMRERGIERITTTIDEVRLREYIQPLSILERGKLRQVGTITNLFIEGGRISEQLRDRHPNNDGMCSYVGEGSTILTGAIPSSSYIWKKNVNVDTTTGVGWNVPSGPGLYFVGLSLHTASPRYVRTGICVDSNGTHVMKPEKESFHVVTFGQFPPQPQPVDPELRFLDTTGSRMTGGYSTQHNRGNLSVSWNICREGVKCAAPPTAADGAISLGDIFEADLAQLRDSVADPKLAGVVSKMEADPSLRPEIRVILKDGSDPVFLEIIAAARIANLKTWFAEHGVDASRIDWVWETGAASDQVLITY